MTDQYRKALDALEWLEESLKDCIVKHYPELEKIERTRELGLIADKAVFIRKALTEPVNSEPVINDAGLADAVYNAIAIDGLTKNQTDTIHDHVMPIINRAVKGEKVAEVTVDDFVNIMGIEGATVDDLSTLKALGVWLKVKFTNGIKIVDGGA